MAQPLVISAASLQYVKVKITVTVAGVAVDPTTDTVKMAFMSTTDAPAGADLKTASWETDSTTSPATHRIICLVGPGGSIVPTNGVYYVWIQILDNPEHPLLPCGIVTVI